MRELLKVVEHEQRLSFAQKLDDLVERLLAAGETHIKLARNPAAQLVRRLDVLEWHKRRAVRKPAQTRASRAVQAGSCQHRRAQSGTAICSHPAPAVEAIRRNSMVRPIKSASSLKDAVGVARGAARSACRANRAAPAVRLLAQARGRRESSHKLVIGLTCASALSATRQP